MKKTVVKVPDVYMMPNINALLTPNTTNQCIGSMGQLASVLLHCECVRGAGEGGANAVLPFFGTEDGPQLPQTDLVSYFC